MSGWNPPPEPEGETCPVCQEPENRVYNDEDFCCQDCKESIFEYALKHNVIVEDLEYDDELDPRYAKAMLPVVEMLLMGQRVQSPDFHIRTGKTQTKILESMTVTGRVTEKQLCTMFPDNSRIVMHNRVRSLYDRGLVNCSPTPQTSLCMETKKRQTELVAGFTITEAGEREMHRNKRSFVWSSHGK